MEMKLAAPTCWHWSQPSVPQSSSFQTLVSTLCSLSTERICLGRSALLGAKLHRSRSCSRPKSRAQTVKRACCASLDAFSNEEFMKRIQDFAMQFQEENTDNSGAESQTVADSIPMPSENSGDNTETKEQFLTSEVHLIDPLDWHRSGEIIPASIEWKANSVDLPLSLRIIRRKRLKQRQDGLRETGESTFCSVNKAFSSMVFIIRELQSLALQMRQMLFYGDLQGILVRVQKEMHLSFVWLFQHVFSHTPSLMVCVMILLANYSVHSMATATAIATTTESVSIVEDQTFYRGRKQRQQRLDSSSTKTFFQLSSSAKTTSVGGNNGGGGKFRPVAGDTEGDGRSSTNHLLPNQASSFARASEDESVSRQVTEEEEAGLWNSILEEARRMQSAAGHEALDEETMRSLVSPVSAKMEADEYAAYSKTELVYLTGLTKEPNNPLLLVNYAQFLHLATHDYNRAEEYFKRAVKAAPLDAQALSKYASFLWQVRKDQGAAEDAYRGAISANPISPYHAADYAYFLWSTDEDDTRSPVNPPDVDTDCF